MNRVGGTARISLIGSEWIDREKESGKGLRKRVKTGVCMSRLGEYRFVEYVH